METTPTGRNPTGVEVSGISPSTEFSLQSLCEVDLSDFGPGIEFQELDRKKQLCPHKKAVGFRASG